jgi:DNA polymerase-3 subunit epsilon
MKKRVSNRGKILKELPFEEQEYSVFDFETTGTSARTEKVIEIGITKIRKGKVVDTFQTYINPGRLVPYHITVLTGITNEDVKYAPYFDEVINDIKEFIGSSVLVAHNLSFDYSFLKSECEQSRIDLPENSAICTLKLAKRIYPHLPSRSLGNLSKSLKIRHRNVHRGLGDSTAAAKIFLKMFKTLREEYSIDTVSDLIHFQNIPSGAPFKMNKKKLAEDYSSVPDDPGIYFFRDSNGNTIYIGKAKSLKQRVSNYFTSNTPRKTKKIVQKAHRLEYYITNTELTALLAEAELIKTNGPKFNTLLKKYSNNYFLMVNNLTSFPTVERVTSFDFNGNDYYGPYPNRETAIAIKEIIDKTFQIRECSEKEFLKEQKCYLADIERCFAPCIYKSIKEKYLDELMKVHNFLNGFNQSAVDRLLNKMKILSEHKKYEEAASTRDLINMVLKQLNKATILSEPINKANVLIEVSGVKENDYLLLLEGKMFIKNYDNSNSFEEVLQNYFAGTIQLFKELTDKDLERLKIALSWLVKNKGKIKVHYLKNYGSIEELANEFIFINKAKRDYQLQE